MTYFPPDAFSQFSYKVADNVLYASFTLPAEAKIERIRGCVFVPASNRKTWEIIDYHDITPGNPIVLQSRNLPTEIVQFQFYQEGKTQFVAMTNYCMQVFRAQLPSAPQ